jgi:subfamily B ATP-binding cassette protein MsbA
MNGLNGTHKASPYMRLLACARPYARRLAAALACMFVASACNIVPPWLLTTS